MPHFICTTCGTQHAESPEPPDRCPICEDERQYIGWQGQQWTTLDRLRADHENQIRTEEPGLTGLGTTPKFGIGQRALLVRSPGGNLLWDCVSLIDEATIRVVNDLGGLSAIAISHPHYYSSMVEWSRAFGGVPIYLHSADRRWVMRPDPALEFWDGETKALHDGITLVRCGGHFEGGTVLHWPAGADEKGALLSGDILQVCMDRRHVSFMSSYPNYIPLPAEAVRRAVAAVEPFAFDRIYGFMFDLAIPEDAKAAVHRSADRYLRMIGAGGNGP
ncbi:MBL fold metallo-hydrolase [Tautonia marina]|uniref:MBL fold metallo-hydrolase n=1 Tax=Tautonia marina TaxID=2653855 RepID=UPI001260686F|nr:MBL fold metallo-hydrolase [Tautonia marina]